MRTKRKRRLFRTFTFKIIPGCSLYNNYSVVPFACVACDILELFCVVVHRWAGEWLLNVPTYARRTRLIDPWVLAPSAVLLALCVDIMIECC